MNNILETYNKLIIYFKKIEQSKESCLKLSNLFLSYIPRIDIISLYVISLWHYCLLGDFEQ